jgi:hypothetical protein
MKVFVRHTKDVRSLLLAGKFFEGYRKARHDYSNYDAEWQSGRDYSAVKAELKVALVEKYGYVEGFADFLARLKD